MDPFEELSSAELKLQIAAATLVRVDLGIELAASRADLAAHRRYIGKRSQLSEQGMLLVEQPRQSAGATVA